MTRARSRTAACLLLGLASAGTAACGGGTAGVRVDAGATGTASSGPTATVDPGPVEVGGTAFRLTLPTGAYRPDPAQVTDTGATVRRWRLPLDRQGTACVVVAGEQPDYGGSFPAVQLAAFGAGRGRGSEVVANEVTAPPKGAVAAVRQELRFVLRRADGGTAPARLHARQLLTAGRTLVSVDAAAPDGAADRCRPEAAVASLVGTGQEYTAPTAPATPPGTTTDPKPDPNGSPTGGAP